MLGRGKAPHNEEVRGALMHMVVQCGMADAAVVETPVTSADGSSTAAGVVFLDSLSFVCFRCHGALNGGVPQERLRAGAVGGQV